VDNYRAVASNCKKNKRRAKPVFYSKISEIYNVFYRNFHLEPFWEGVSGEIKTTFIMNLPTIYQNVMPPTIGYRILPNPR
jgi:hypothetical protein